MKTKYTAAVLLVFAILFVAMPLSAQETIRTVTPDEFFSALESMDGEGIVIDIRTPSEFKRGHAPVALSIDYYAADFRDKLDGLDRDKAYFIYCNSGNRSGRSLSIFSDLGFTQVYDLAGGWSANSRRLLALKE